MFFLLSKILYFIIQPLNWVLGLMLYSLFAKNRNRKRQALLAAIVLAFFFSNRFIVNQFMGWWEVESITADRIDHTYDIGILLGGYSNANILPRHDRQNFSHRAARFLNAYELYKMGKVKKLLLTGGSGDLLQEKSSEASDMQGFLSRIGVPPEDVIIEPGSRNTYENAIFTKKILEEKYKGSSCLLITSAFHMRRSAGCFEKASVEFTPYSVDFIHEKDRWAPENTLIPDRNGFYFWEVLVKEWAGYLAYWASGYL